MQTVIVDTTQWQRQPKAADGTPVYYIGRVDGQPGVFAVSVPPRGGTKYFCGQHKTLFRIGGQCPECARSELKIEAPVTPL
jgi:hypothetical protein